MHGFLFKTSKLIPSSFWGDGSRDIVSEPLTDCIELHKLNSHHLFPKEFS